MKEADIAALFTGEPSYRTSNPKHFRDSNTGPPASEAGALTTRPQERPAFGKKHGIGPNGIYLKEADIAALITGQPSYRTSNLNLFRDSNTGGRLDH